MPETKTVLIMEEKAEKLLNDFNQRYGGYIVIDLDVCKAYLKMLKTGEEPNLDLFYDFVLSQDLAEEVIP